MRGNRVAEIYREAVRPPSPGPRKHKVDRSHGRLASAAWIRAQKPAHPGPSLSATEAPYAGPASLQTVGAIPGRAELFCALHDDPAIFNLSTKRIS